MMGMLHFAKEVPAILGAQAQRKWVCPQMTQLAGQCVGLVGFGTIGKQVARLARAMGLRVMALRRTHGDAADVEVVHGAEGLGRLMREADYVVIAAPLTPKTRGMVGADELALMKPSGVLINVGRGKASPPPRHAAFV